jgi:peptide/nickel transport system substrate-binding protein
MNRRQFMLTLGLAAGALAACGTRPPATQPNPTSEEARSDQQKQAITPEPATPTVAGAGSSQTLVIGSVEEPDTLHPFVSYMFTTQKIMYGVMSPLINFDAQLNIVPALAESYTISEDGKVYTFRLNPKAKWHDGTPFTSADVAATREIILNPAFGANGPFGWDKTESVETPDAHTAVVKLNAPFSPFLVMAANWLVAPKHLIDKGVDAFKRDFGRNPIGTGPYKFAKWESGQQIVLEKNTDYFGPAPSIAQIVIKFVPNTNTLLTQLQTGEVDFTDALTAIDYNAATALPGFGVKALTGVNWTHISLKNLDHLQDKRVRQALDFATPRQQIIEKLLNGLAEVAVSDQSPTSPYFNPNVKVRPYDVDKAKALLKEGGFVQNTAGIWEKNGSPLKIEYWIETGNMQSKQVSQAIIASWRKLGVDVSEHEQDIRNWMTPDGFPFRKAMTAGQFEWFNFLDPDNMGYWHSSMIPAKAGGTGTNLPAFFAPYERQALFDELTAAGAAENDPEKRKAIYWRLQELVHEEVPVIFLYWGKRIFAAKNSLSYETNAAMPLLFNAEQWRLQPATS